jgi:hypothetical protein
MKMAVAWGVEMELEILMVQMKVPDLCSVALLDLIGDLMLDSIGGLMWSLLLSERTHSCVAANCEQLLVHHHAEVWQPVALAAHFLVLARVQIYYYCFVSLVEYNLIHGDLSPQQME